MEKCKLMTPLFYRDMFNWEGRKMRAVLEREISNGAETYRIWRRAGKAQVTYPQAKNDKYLLYVELNGYLAPLRILLDVEHPDDTWKQYLTSKKLPDLTELQIGGHIIEVHKKFISTIVSYLNITYHLTVDTDKVQGNFVPLLQENEVDAIETALRSLVLSYEDIIELILSWFDGRSFSEQAPYEMFNKCHRAAWRKSDHQPNYQQKKNLVKIFSGACSYCFTQKEQQASAHGQWIIALGAKEILKGAAHFECGAFEEYPDGIDDLLSEQTVISEWNDQWEFEDCTKLERIKLFKNGRMDIRFTNEGYARQFVADYLGTIW